MTTTGENSYILNLAFSRRFRNPLEDTILIETMSNLTLYLKHRPQRFSDLAGQPHIVSALTKAAATGTSVHAYLFCGVRGTGKTSTARILAKALNCENLQEGEPCCECESCLSHQNGSSFDRHELDAASNNGVNDMRGLLEKVGLSTAGKKKVYILDEVHMLTDQASNAFLTTLGDPPDHVVFILCTTEPHKLLPTIRSRCQTLNFLTLSDKDMREHLKAICEKEGGYGDSEKQWIEASVKKAGGSVRDALSALQGFVSGGEQTEQQFGDDLAFAMAEESAQNSFAAVAAAAKEGCSMRLLCEEASEVLRDAFLAACGAADLVEDNKKTDKILDMSPPVRSLTCAIEILGEAASAMRSSPAPRLELEYRLAKIYGEHLSRQEPPEELPAELPPVQPAKTEEKPKEAAEPAENLKTEIKKTENAGKDIHPDSKKTIEDIFAADIHPEAAPSATEPVKSFQLDGERTVSATIQKSAKKWSPPEPAKQTASETKNSIEEKEETSSEKSQGGLF